MLPLIQIFFFFRERISSNMFLTDFFFPHAHDGHICGSLVLIVTQRHFSSANLQSYWLPSVRDEGGQVLFLQIMETFWIEKMKGRCHVLWKCSTRLLPAMQMCCFPNAGGRLLIWNVKGKRKMSDFQEEGKVSGWETAAPRKRQEAAAAAAAEVKRLIFCWSGMDRIRNEDIRGTERVRCFGDEATEVRLRWFWHRRRRDSQQE